MDVIDPKAGMAKARRKPPQRKSVIEATPAAPMPVVAAMPAADEAPATVEAAAAAEPATLTPEPTTAVPEPVETAAPTSVSALEVLPEPAPFSTAAIQPVVPPAAVPAEPTEDVVMDTATVENAANTATGKGQEMLTDLNERAKGAMEKSTKMAEEFATFGKGNVEAIVESSRIAARGLESLGQDAAAFAKAQFEQQTAALRQFSSVKSPTEFLKLQGDLMRQSFDQMVQQSSRSTETMLKLAGEVVQPLSNRFAVAAEKAKIQA